MDAGEGVGIQGAPQVQAQFVPRFLYGVKRPQREAIHSPTRNARLYNTWIFYCTTEFRAASASRLFFRLSSVLWRGW